MSVFAFYQNMKYYHNNFLKLSIISGNVKTNEVWYDLSIWHEPNLEFDLSINEFEFNLKDSFNNLLFT